MLRLENALAIFCFVLLVAENVRFRHALAVPKELPGGPDRRRQAFPYGRRLDVGPVRRVRAFPVGDWKLFAARHPISRDDCTGTLCGEPMPNCSLYVP